MFGDVESFPTELETFSDRSWQEDDVLGIPVTQEVTQVDVTLGCACGQTRAGADALDVPNDDGHLGEIRQAGKVGHQTDPRAGGGSHGTQSGPTCPDDHTGSRQFIFSLDHSKTVLSGCGIFPRKLGRYVIKDSATEDAGVMGYQAANCTPP